MNMQKFCIRTVCWLWDKSLLSFVFAIFSATSETQFFAKMLKGAASSAARRSFFFGQTLSFFCCQFLLFVSPAWRASCRRSAPRAVPRAVFGPRAVAEEPGGPAAGRLLVRFLRNWCFSLLPLFGTRFFEFWFLRSDRFAVFFFFTSCLASLNFFIDSLKILRRRSFGHFSCRCLHPS